MSTTQESNDKPSALKAAFMTDGNNPDLPSARTQKGYRDDIAPPFSRVRMDTFVYTLSIGALLLGLFYTFRMSEWKFQQPGIFNLLMGRHPDAPPAAANVQE